MSIEKEIADLQAQVAFQEDTIEQMTRTLVEQQNEMYEIRQMMKHLQKQVTALTPSDIDGDKHEVPPHY